MNLLVDTLAKVVILQEVAAKMAGRCAVGSSQDSGY